MSVRRLFLALILVLAPGTANAQDALTIQELELEYNVWVQRHQAALDAWEVLESRFQRSLNEQTSADASGDANRIDRAFTVTQQLSSEIRVQERRVGELAQEVRDARSALLETLRERIDDLIRQSESATDPAEQEELAALLRDANSRHVQLRAEEDPETSLEPMQEITIDIRDTPEIILRKADNLDFRADQYEARLVGVRIRLEELRADQRRTRRANDFIAGVERYDDTRVSVVSPGNTTVSATNPGQLPPGSDTLGVEVRPLTLEERIQSLELLEGGLQLRLQQVRDKAERFRARAGGGGS